MRRLQAFALVLALTIVFALTTVTAMAQAPPGLMRAAIAAQEQHTPQLLTNPDIVGTALGLEGNEPVVKVLLKRDGVRGLPGHLDGFRVVPFVTGELFALGKPGTGGIDRTARFKRPVPIGVSTGHPDITAGTIGCRVTGADGKKYALSNNHVYANENDAVINVDNVLQPGPYDGGKDPADSIGTLSAFEEIYFEEGLGDPPVNTIDAAIALSSLDLLGNATPSDGYGLPKSTPIAEAIGMNVMKYGRTTGLTKGKIDSIHATVRVSYDTGIATFSGQIVITPGRFSAGGDSGSLIVANDVTVVGKGKNATVTPPGENHRRPVGLLFAGSNTVTIANPIQDVLDRFGVAIDGD